MGLLPREASFAEEVADFFLAFRGAGVSLSPLDAELLLAWHQAGVPYDVVCRGIRRAAEKRAHHLAPGEPLLRTLRSCAKAVDDERKRAMGLRAGRATRSSEPAKAPDDPLARARAALRKAIREGTAPVRRSATQVLPLARDPEVDPARAFARVARIDEALALCYLRALPFSQRLALLRAARAPLAAALSRMSPRARRAALRAHRVLHARTHGELPALR